MIATEVHILTSRGPDTGFHLTEDLVLSIHYLPVSGNSLILFMRYRSEKHLPAEVTISQYFELLTLSYTLDLWDDLGELCTEELAKKTPDDLLWDTFRQAAAEGWGCVLQALMMRFDTVATPADQIPDHFDATQWSGIPASTVLDMYRVRFRRSLDPERGSYSYRLVPWSEAAKTFEGGT